MRPEAVAVVGTGRMGAAMVGRLRAAGHPVVAYNRSRARAEATGATVVDTPREAADAADSVIVSLADDAAVRQVYAGPDGLAAGVRSGAVVLETSTVAPDTVRAVAPLIAERSATLLDAPVSGSVPVVERGELTFMVGGDAAALQQVRPVLDTLGAKILHLGDLGNGAVMKLAVNSVVLALNQALSEALVLAEKAGVDREAAYQVFASSVAAGPYVHYKREAFEHPEKAAVAFMLDLAAKDLSLVADLADRVGARMEQLAANRRVVAEAKKAGLGEHDMSAIATFLRGGGPDGPTP